MPIYEYRCQKCGNDLEVMHKVNDPSPTQCPKCHEPALARMMSRTSFQLKGGGWGSDLYASAKKGDASGTATPSTSTSTTTAAPAPASSSTTTTSAPAAPASSGSGTSGGGTGGGSGGGNSGGSST